MRVRRFNLEYPNGKLFTDPEELRKAEESGEWTDGAHKIHNKELYIATPVPKEPTQPEETQEPPQVEETPAPAQKYCECGCGTPVVKRFVHGHYGKMRKKNGHREDSQPPD